MNFYNTQFCICKINFKLIYYNSLFIFTCLKYIMIEIFTKWNVRPFKIYSIDASSLQGRWSRHLRSFPFTSSPDIFARILWALWVIDKIFTLRRKLDPFWTKIKRVSIIFYVLWIVWLLIIKLDFIYCSNNE